MPAYSLGRGDGNAHSTSATRIRRLLSLGVTAVLLLLLPLLADAASSWDPESLPHPNAGWPSWLVRLYLPRGSPVLSVGTPITARLELTNFYGLLNLTMPINGSCQFDPPVVQFTSAGDLSQDVQIMPTALADPIGFPNGGEWTLTITPTAGASTYGISALSWNPEIWPAHNPAGLGGTECPAGNSSDH